MLKGGEVSSAGLLLIDSLHIGIGIGIGLGL